MHEFLGLHACTLMVNFEDTVGRARWHGTSHLHLLRAQHLMVVLIGGASLGWVPNELLVLRLRVTEAFIIHLSETVIGGLARRLIEEFLKVRVRRSIVDNLLNKETSIPLRLVLDSSASVGLSDSNVGHLLSDHGRSNLLRRCLHYHGGLLNFRQHNRHRLRFFLFDLGGRLFRHIVMLNLNCTNLFSLEEKLERGGLKGGRSKILNWDELSLTDWIVVNDIFIDDSQDHTWLSIELVSWETNGDRVLLVPYWFLTCILMRSTSIKQRSLLWWETNKFNFALRIHFCEKITIFKQLRAL